MSNRRHRLNIVQLEDYFFSAARDFASANRQFQGYLEAKAGGPIEGDLLRKVGGWSVENISRVMGLGTEAHRAKQDVELELLSLDQVSLAAGPRSGLAAEVSAKPLR